MIFESKFVDNSFRNLTCNLKLHYFQNDICKTLDLLQKKRSTHMTLQKPMRIEHSKMLRVYVAREVILAIFSWISVFKKHALWKPSTGVGDMDKMFNFRPTVWCKTNFSSPRAPLIESFAFVKFWLTSKF